MVLCYDSEMISRRKFIQGLSTLFATMPLALLAHKKPKGFKLTTLKVAGLQYGDAVDTDFSKQQPLTLLREHSNKYDRYATAIYYQGKKVGYIPRENSRIIASLIDNGVSLDASVRYFDMDAKSWERMWVSIWQVG